MTLYMNYKNPNAYKWNASLNLIFLIEKKKKKK